MYVTAMAAVITPKTMEGLISGNPWAIIAVLFVVIAVIAKKIYGDMKKEQATAADAAAAREDRLIKIDEAHRVESREREHRLMDQLDTSTKQFSEIVNVVNKISDSQEKMLQTQQETVESIRYLNNDIREIKERQDRLERIGQLNGQNKTSKEEVVQ